MAVGEGRAQPRGFPSAQCLISREAFSGFICFSLSLSVFTFQSFFNRGHGAPLGGPGPRQQQGGARLGAAQSPFSDLNRQLVNMGFPQWHLGNHAVEPVTSILLLFLLMMLGVRGLLLVGLVYLVSHLSQR